MKIRRLLVLVAAGLITLVQTLVFTLAGGVVHAADADTDALQSVAIIGARTPPDEKSNTQVSLVGIGALYWAARHPRQAWKVLLPVQPRDATDVSADIKARCALFATSTLDQNSAGLRPEAACFSARGDSVR